MITVCLTSAWCSLILSFNFLFVWPTYVLSQSLQGIVYATSLQSYIFLLSLNLVNWFLTVFLGLWAKNTFPCLRILAVTSKTQGAQIKVWFSISTRTDTEVEIKNWLYIYYINYLQIKFFLDKQSLIVLFFLVCINCFEWFSQRNFFWWSRKQN